MEWENEFKEMLMRKQLLYDGDFDTKHTIMDLVRSFLKESKSIYTRYNKPFPTRYGRKYKIIEECFKEIALEDARDRYNHYYRLFDLVEFEPMGMDSFRVKVK